MSTIAQNITALTNQRIADRQSKENIRQAIIAEGVAVPENTPLSDYDDKVALIDEWVAPSDWIQLEEPADNEILLLASDINPYYAFVVNVTGGYTVNWGDGTVDNWASGATASHTYTVGAGQACSRGYTTFKIRIYAQVPANQISRFYIVGKFKQYTHSYLWAKFGTTGLTSLYTSFVKESYPYAYCRNLESVELPNSLIYCSSFNRFLLAATMLKKIRMPLNYYSGVIDFTYAFYLTSLSVVDFRALSLSVNSISATFSGANNLRSIKFPTNLLSCTSFASQDLPNIKELLLPVINTDITDQWIFRTWKSLYKIQFDLSWENRISNISYLFEGNVRLTEIINTPKQKLNYNASIDACHKDNMSLQSVRCIINTNASVSAQNVYFNCVSLKQITEFPSLPNLTNIAGFFYSCNLLEDPGNLDQLGDTTTGMDLTTTYAGCYSLNPAGGLRVRNKITGRFVLAGIDVNNRAALQALLFTNPGAVSTWAGASPQIDVSYCSMDVAALNALFTSIIATSASFSGKTIRITGNPGAETCDTTIITNAGGTVNKTT